MKTASQGHYQLTYRLARKERGGWRKGGGERGVEGGAEGGCRRGVQKGGAEGGESYFFFFYPTLTTIQIKIFLYVIPKLKICHLSDSVYDVDVMV